ncbi:MAG: putative lipid II flippase FtsW [Myxococcota bacterium]
MNAKMQPAPTTLPLPAGVAHASLAEKIDPWLIGATVALVGLGVVMVYSASAVRAYGAGGGSGSSFLFRHLFSIAVGLTGMFAALRIPTEKWSRYAYPLLAVSFLMLCLVFVPGIGRRINGAVRWINLGFMGFQPGELAKLAVVVYLAHSLAKKRERVASFSIGFVPHVLVTSAMVLLILIQPDFGTSVIIFATLGLMMFVAGTRIGYLLIAMVLALPVGFIYVHLKPHAFQRLVVFLDPEAYKSTTGYQIWESLVSFGSGGPFGVGLGQGHQKLYFLPEAHSDFVFAVVGEELGFFGVVLVLGLFAVLIGRALIIARRASVRFSMFLAFGIAAWLGCQALINMMVVVALVPTKGLTLPFVSFGGSSMIIGLTAIGVLLRLTAEERALAGHRGGA